MDREDILNRLKSLDMRADVRIKDNKRYSCIIVGGGALMLLGFSMRVTDDVDVLKSDLPKELFSVMNELDINTNVSAYNSCFPWDYFSRAQLVDLDTEKIDFYTISIEDLVISKIAAHREKDLFDIMNENVIARLDFPCWIN